MTPDELKDWLRANADDISGFTEYEITMTSDAELHRELGESWFGDDAWNERGYRFVHLGQDATGGLVALWLRRGLDSPPPVVFFGSEGGCGVLAATPEAWAKVLAYGPAIVEHAEGDTSALSRDENWYLADDSDPEQRDEARGHLEVYRKATIERFGSLEPFEDLAAVNAADQQELTTWVAGVLERVFDRHEKAKREAAAKKHQESREKAETHAASSAAGLPEDARERADGWRYEGRCPSCGRRGELRLTRFEELSFGICFDCYFSPAW